MGTLGEMPGSVRVSYKEYGLGYSEYYPLVPFAERACPHPPHLYVLQLVPKLAWKPPQEVLPASSPARSPVMALCFMSVCLCDL